MSMGNQNTCTANTHAASAPIPTGEEIAEAFERDYALSGNFGLSIKQLATNINVAIARAVNAATQPAKN